MSYKIYYKCFVLQVMRQAHTTLTPVVLPTTCVFLTNLNGDITKKVCSLEEASTERSMKQDIYILTGDPNSLDKEFKMRIVPVLFALHNDLQSS